MKNHQPLTSSEKIAILEQLEGKSIREVEKKLAIRSSTPEIFLHQDSIRPVTESHSKIAFVASQELLDDLEKIKALFSHQYPQMTLAELIAEMAKVTLAKLESKKFAKVENPKSESLKSQDLGSGSSAGSKTAKEAISQSRNSPASVKRAVEHIIYGALFRSLEIGLRDI